MAGCWSVGRRLPFGRCGSSRNTLLGAMVLLAASIGFSDFVRSEVPRVLPSGQAPQDRRLQPLKDLDGYFPFTPSPNTEAWQRRAEQVRRQTLVSLGLWPLPTKTPLNPVIHGKVEREEYTVERVYFESMPGFFVTGSLYRPKGKTGRLPAVLCPHGHWANGRFYDVGEAGVKKEIASGAEKFVEGGRSPLQARCVHLARMGCVVFFYDMIGYADNLQISFEVAHRFAKQRPDMTGPQNWGLFSPQAESHFQSVMGLQAWNSVRALDFLSSLPDVDAERIGVTGASGGGTQTFILGVIDPRPKVSFPAVMVSTAMQGGCTCENCCNLRIGTGNVEFAALFAPKPIGMSAADDWTKEMTTKGFPELQQHYRMLGVPDNVFLISRTEFGHNYNAVSREAMYGWFAKHLGFQATPERDYRRLSQEELTVWGEGHPRPPAGPDFERRLLQWWAHDTAGQLDGTPGEKLRDVVRPALEVVIGRQLPTGSDLNYDQKIKEDQGDYIYMAGLLQARSHGEELPVAFFYPKNWRGEVVIWLDPAGKSALGSPNQPTSAVKQLLAAGQAVAGADLFLQGEFVADGQPVAKARKVKNTREAAAYSYGYNSTLFAQRVHDVLSLIAFVKNHDRTPQAISLVGLEGTAGAWAAAARVVAGDVVTRTVLDTKGFRFLAVNDIYSTDFLPGGAKYGDLPGMLMAGAPGKLWLAGETPEVTARVGKAFAAAGQPDALVPSQAQGAEAQAAAVAWLLQQAK